MMSFSDEKLDEIRIGKLVQDKIEREIQDILSNYFDVTSEIDAPNIEELRITIKTEIKDSPFSETIHDNERKFLCWIIDNKIILRDPKSLKEVE